MASIKELEDRLHHDAETRYSNFSIVEVGDIKDIYEDTYLEKPTWLGGDKEFTCLFIDLDKSSKRSFKSQPKTMAKIYDYFTQSLVDILNESEFAADYIDIKGDGAFGIYEGPDGAFRALVAATTFSTFFNKYIRPKFQTLEQSFNFKAAIHIDKILVKRIGSKGPRNNNEVWAGRLVNKTAKLASKTADIYPSAPPEMSEYQFGLLVISERVRSEYFKKKEFAIIHCGHDTNGNDIALCEFWTAFDASQDEDLSENIIYYYPPLWCSKCADRVKASLLA